MPITPDATLKERGWEEPLDESPVETPDRWHGGSVAHTGGGIHCRIWTTKTEAQTDTETPDPDVYYNAVYGREFDGVTIEVYEYREGRDLWDRREELDRQLCSKGTDLACAEVAAKLMEKHRPPPAGSDQPAFNDLAWDDLTGTYEGVTVTVTEGHLIQAYFEAVIGTDAYVARVPIGRNQMEAGLTEGEYSDIDVVVSANDWTATHDRSEYEQRSGDWKRRIHCLFKLDGTAIEAPLDEIRYGSKSGNRVWAGWNTDAQPTAAQAESHSPDE